MMESISECIVAWSILNKASVTLHEPTFDNLVFRFASIALEIPKNANRQRYERALGHFRAQYYNEFMYKVVNRSEECCRFIQMLTSFTIHAKFQKKNYIELFVGLFSFYQGSVGGSYNNIPLLMGPVVPLTSSPAYHSRWNWDKVMVIRATHGFVLGRCASCSKRCTTERKVGLYMCPAGSLSLCVGCEIGSELLEPYLQDCLSWLLPPPSVELQEHLKDSLEVCQQLATAPNRKNLIQDLRFGVLKHGKVIVADNVRLTASNKELTTTVDDLQKQCKHAFATSEECHISLRNINESRYQLENNLMGREQQVSELHRTCQDLQNRLNESVRQQWELYNRLMTV